MTPRPPLPPGSDTDGLWLDDPAHRAWLADQAARLLAFHRDSLDPAGGFHVLGLDGRPLAGAAQELHATTRMLHSFALGHLAGRGDCLGLVDHGMRYLDSHHRDRDHGGWLWGLQGKAVTDDRKLAYGHVFVLLAGSAAKMVGHPDADRLIAEATGVLWERFWEDGPGLFADEWARDWTPFSDYRGMNANMHGVEALMAAFEATGQAVYLDRAGRIVDFFLRRMAPAHGWRIPEHYRADWTVDRGYSGNPMFRPPGVTPGHSFEWARLLLQWWDLAGRPEDGSVATARAIAEQAMAEGWDAGRGGIHYTLDFDGQPAIRARYWWPVTEAIGVFASLLKLDPRPGDEAAYRRLWGFADAALIDHDRGGWYPEIDDAGRPTDHQFAGKPDIYHALQACLFPLAPGLSRAGAGLAGLRPLAG